MTTDPVAQRPIVESLASEPIPFDLFREVHKGLRFAIFRLTELAGSADYRASSGRDEVLGELRRVLVLLHAHHRHEDIFVKPLLELVDDELAAAVDSGHLEIDRLLTVIEATAELVGASSGGEAVAGGLELYRKLARFAGVYLGHMSLEEGEVMETMRAAMPLQDLLDVEMAIRTRIPIELMCDFIAVMAPAMNVDERTNMLRAMREGAPPEVFERFRAATAASLAEGDYSAVARRLAR